MLRRRRETWAQQETMQFISLFGDVDVQKKLNSCHRNQAVYEQLAERMKKHGFKRTAQQLRVKAKDLKKQYRDIKKSGRQLSKHNSFWKYYNILDSILSDDSKGPKAVTSSTPAIKHSEKRAEGQKNVTQPKEQLHSSQSQECGSSYNSSRASQKLSDPSHDASAVSSSVVQMLSRRGLQRPRTSPAITHVKARSRRCWSLVHFSKVFLHYSKNMEKFQEIFQNHLGMERQEREKIQKEASRTRKEIKTAASQMREAILVQAEAINKVAEAINRYNDLLECVISEPDPQSGD